jgi:uncharacterized membrane protein
VSIGGTQVSNGSNPRGEGARRVSIVLAGLGLVDTLYLTWLKLANATASCSGLGDCDAVNSSRYSEIAGIPIALLGAGAYVIVLGLLLAEARAPGRAEALRLVVFGVALSASLYSAYLTYVEVAILEAICPFCVVSAVLFVTLLIISVLRLRDVGADE